MFTLFLVAETLLGQLSPGKLTSAHADLEGISNCTQCHELGNQVLSSKCLECHQEIQSLQDDRRGYHSNFEVTSKECFDCHSEHHGRNFDMLHFDENEFDHDLSGYVLEATHLAIDCRDCHKPDYIDDPDLQKREKTYLGLDQECLSCHADFHQESLSSNCIECHNFEKFRPAPGFDHDESAFALNGKHIDVDCIECHPTTFRNGEDFQVFSGIEFNDCVSCHEDPHANQLVGSCSQCHSEESFSAGNALGNFNHNTTAFQLRGSHQNINCFECHDKTSNPKRVFQDLFAVNQNDCVACHENTHAGRFGNECVECHRETKFSDLRSMDLFDHQVTDFELEGLHVGVDCKSCHAGSYLEPIDFSACQNCHEDYHNGEFEDKLLVNDCGDCHTVFQDFTFTTFTVEKHEESSFPLDGSHLATPCFECHISEDRWTFREIGNECIDCHEDIHDGYISEKYYPETLKEIFGNRKQK